MSTETSEIVVSQNSEDSQRASAITDPETSIYNVLLFTMQAMIKGMNEMLQAMNKSQQDDDD